MLLIYFESVKNSLIASDTGKSFSVYFRDTEFEDSLKVSHIIVDKARPGELLGAPGILILSLLCFQDFSLLLKAGYQCKYW